MEALSVFGLFENSFENQRKYAVKLLKKKKKMKKNPIYQEPKLVATRDDPFMRIQFYAQEDSRKCSKGFTGILREILTNITKDSREVQ